jgi:vacuolar-type H+-ATPase subunit E/Vma4
MEERRQKSRLLVSRDEFLQRLNQEAKARLVTAASSNATAYSNLLKGLIKQGLARLEGETRVEVRCRPQDLAAAQKAAPQAAAEFSAEGGPNGAQVSVTVVADPALGTSAGGIVLAGAEGRIRCSNTLEDRLALALNDLQPVIRDLLFPSARAEVRTKPAVLQPEHAQEVLPAGGAAAKANAAAARAEQAAAAAAAAAAQAQSQQQQQQQAAAAAFGTAAPGGSDPFAF